MPDLFDEMPASFRPTAGAPIPDWRVVYEWIETHNDTEDLHSIWTKLAHQWLARIADWRPPGLRIDEYADFLLLSALDKDAANRTLRFMQRCRDQLCATFPKLVLQNAVGPFVGMVFRDENEYYDYVSEYYPEEGEFGASAGMFLHEGYGHFVAVEIPRWNLRHVLAHEIVHDHFAERDLPLWIEEGLTQTATDLLLGENSLRLDHEMLIRQRAYWREHGLDSFWSGEAFDSPDDGQELAYVLAHVTFLRELQDNRDAFLTFLETASLQDNGAAASLRHLGEPLEALAAKFLGPDH